MKILITGAHGLLGKSLQAHLQQKKLEPVCLVHKQLQGADQNTYTQLESLQADHPHFDIIYHLAAYIPYGSMNDADPRLVDTNIALTFRIAKTYPQARIVFASSVSVYGENQENPIRPESAFINPSMYGLSKLAGEAILKNQKSYAIIRFSSLVGRGMPSVSFIPRALQQAAAGTLVLKGTGSRQQNYLDARDAARLCEACALHSENLLLLGVGNASYSNLEVAQMITTQKPAAIRHESEDNSPSFHYDNGTMYDLVGHRNLYTLEESINEMIRA